MPVNRYGVLKGEAKETIDGTAQSPHYQVKIEDGQGGQYRIAVNISSQSQPSQVLYFASEEINTDETTKLSGLSTGFTFIQNNQPGIGLDFQRGNLFDHTKMIPLPDTLPGPNNDLNEAIDGYFKAAIQENAIVYAFGDIWENESAPDQYFHFSPGNGIHDIHMNQGNVGQWTKDDGIWQDGGILINFEKTSQKWVGIFLAFQSQSWCTDENGHAIKPVDECNYKTT
jgi:uncharacterized protein YukJ